MKKLKVIIVLMKTLYHSTIDLEFWLQEMEAKLNSDELGRDIASVDTLIKKHHLLEADIKAHEVTPNYFIIT